MVCFGSHTSRTNYLYHDYKNTDWTYETAKPNLGQSYKLFPETKNNVAKILNNDTNLTKSIIYVWRDNKKKLTL